MVRASRVLGWGFGAGPPYGDIRLYILIPQVIVKAEAGSPSRITETNWSSTVTDPQAALGRETGK